MAGEELFKRRLGTRFFRRLTGGTSINVSVDENNEQLLVISTEGNVIQNLWETIVADAGSTTANSSSDSLAIIGNSGISTSITGDILTITSSNIGSVVEDTMPELGGELDAQNFKIVNLATPTLTGDAATKAYVDSVAIGLDVKDSVRVATTAPGTLSIDFTNGDVIDGVTLITGDRILIKNQTAGNENGVYVVQASGAPVRAVDADTDPKVTSGMFTFVEEGTTQTGSGWVLITPDPISVGTTNLIFTQFSDTTGPIMSVFGRSGIIVAEAGDYNATQIDFMPDGSISSTNVQAAITELDTDLIAHIGSGGSSHLDATTSVSGFMSSADKTKLDGIETGATGDQTAADIRTLGFFDTTNDGTGSGLDADLLDGNHASAFATAAQGLLADTALQNIVEDTTPQLGGNLDINGFGFDISGNLIVQFTSGGLAAVNNIDIENAITGTGPTIRSVGADTNIDLILDPKGTGNLVLDGLSWPNTDGTNGQFLITDGSGNLSFVPLVGVLNNIVEDTTPQLGGQLDVNGFAIGNGTQELIAFVETGSAVNEITIINAATGNGPEIAATGDDTNVNLLLTPKGTGNLVLDGLSWPNADGTNNQAIITNGSGVLSFTEIIPATTFTTQTTNAIQTTIASISIASGTSLYFTIRGHGRENVTGDTKGSKIDGVIANNSGTTALIGSLHIIDIDSPGAATWDITAEANDTTDALDIKVTGEAAHTIDWKLRIETIEE